MGLHFSYSSKFTLRTSIPRRPPLSPPNVGPTIFPFLFLPPASQATVLWSIRPPPMARSTAATTRASSVATRVGRAWVEVNGDGAAGVVLDVDEDDTHAFLDELRRRRLADPAGGTGGQSDFPGQPAAIPQARRKLRSNLNFCQNITFTRIIDA